MDRFGLRFAHPRILSAREHLRASCGRTEHRVDSSYLAAAVLRTRLSTFLRVAL
jgi:hypothetical protein